MIDFVTEFLDYPLFTLAGTLVTVGTMLAAVTIMVITVIVSRLIQRSVGRVIDQRSEMKDDGTIVAIRRLVHYIVMLVGFGIALDTIGIDLAALFAAGAFVAIALGFAMQDIAQNFVSGVILLLERSITRGDILEVDGQVVRVTELRLRATLARTREDEELIIPNAQLVQTTVKNYTLRDSLYRVRAPVGVHYGSDLEIVFETLTEVAGVQPWRSSAKPPRILLVGFGNSSVDFEVSVWVDDPWDARVFLSQLNNAIWWALKESDITIAYPQMDVHLDTSVEEAMRGPRA